MKNRLESHRFTGRLIVSTLVIIAGMSLLGLPAHANDGDTVPQPTYPHVQQGSNQFQITTLSSRNDLISGGTVLVRIGVSPDIPLADVTVHLNGINVTSSFTADAQGGTLEGLVQGLKLGDNRLIVQKLSTQTPAPAKSIWSELTLTNHPITGPILSGPHIEPYECRLTENGLGAELDAECSATATISYFYVSSITGFTALPPGPYPSDLVYTTTNAGVTVPYIVRVETGTVNRGIYRIAVLDNPLADPKQGAFKPGPGWNQKVIFQFNCCGSAQYNQGLIYNDSATYPSSILSDNELSRGFALINSTEMFNEQHSNPHLQAETLMMLKEYFIKNYGMPKWSAGVGGSGGALQQYLVTQLAPGLLDGLQPSLSFPEANMPAVWECRLLDAVYAADPTTWTIAKQQAVNGFLTTGNNSSNNTCVDWDQSFADVIVADNASGCGFLNPVNVPFNPVSNPKGARCDFFDTNANLLGRDPATGFAYRPTDNVGVQYGLAALNQQQISPAEFLELNSLIGGFDVNGHPQAQRMVANEETLARVYRGGFENSFMGGGLTTVPIITQRNNADGTNLIHDNLEDLIIRARLIRTYGRADNQIIWRQGSLTQINQSALSLDLLNQWLDNIAADPGPLNTDKVVRNKPAGAVDTCWDQAGNKIVEPATLDPSSRCNTIYPYYSQPQLVAGQALTKSVLKCQLKPIDFNDYNVIFTESQQSQLQSIYPNGVCDYSRPGVGEQPLLGTYLQLSLP
jgi:hypothetical protein